MVKFYLGGGGKPQAPHQYASADNECNVFVLTHLVQIQYQFLFVHRWRNVPKSETNFWKQCIITEQWNTAMAPNLYP